MIEKAIEPVTIAELLTGSSLKVGEDNQQRGPLFRIGDLAHEFGLSLRALRFYEDKGLLSPRRAGVTRLYDREDHTRLRLILFGRQIGFTLAETKQLIDLWKEGASDLSQLNDLRATLSAKLAELEKKKLEIDRSIEELKALLKRLITPSA
ncbi:MerR family DNA-binding transcriptional regulator [Ochrobactrum sp. Q0168]|uniref:MerR family transcriptional regulator n=1 Tax=Ochrobactrum sp. Q0168 TaxID=2793241 RepID=UPI0018EA39DF|nr:MerR family DNA-binding transcriptional regulator [Ochrobactrum sp. Q0168]